MQERGLTTLTDPMRDRSHQPGREAMTPEGDGGADRADLRPARWVQPLAGHRDEGTAAPDTNGDSRDIVGPGGSFMI